VKAVRGVASDNRKGQRDKEVAVAQRFLDGRVQSVETLLGFIATDAHCDAVVSHSLSHSQFEKYHYNKIEWQTLYEYLLAKI